MSNELKINDDALSAEVGWLTKMPSGGTPETAVIQITSFLSALMLRRTDLNQYRESVLPAEGVGQSSVCVDAMKLSEGLRSVSGPLVLTVDTDQLSIKSAKLTVRIKAAKVNFPKWPQFESTADQAVVGARQIARVLTSVGTDETVPALLAVAFDGGSMISTDRFRLSRITYDGKSFTGKVPGAALRAFAKTDGVVYVEPGRWPEVSKDDWVELSSGGRTLITQMADTPFPQWKQLIPSDAPVRVAVRRDDLLSAAGGEEVRLTIDGDTLTVVSSSDSVEIERAVPLVETLRNNLDGPFTVTLRSKYINDALRGISSGLALLEVTAPDRPVVLQDIGESDLHLIMPIREPRAAG